MSRASLAREADKILTRFRRSLRAEYSDAQAYLFGSHADGTMVEDSDFDIVVISDRFRGQSYVSRVAAIRQLAPEEKAFEILAYTPAEFREALGRSVAIQDARRYWRRIV